MQISYYFMESHNTIKQENKSKPIQCLLRAMSILEFVSSKEGVGVSEIAASQKLHVATTHNILRTLCLGAMLVNLKGSYHIGPAAARLSFSWAPMQILPSLATEPMKRMSKATGETGFIGVTIGDVAELMPLCSGDSEIVVRLQKKRYDSPLAVASGRLLVALGEKSRWDHYITHHINSGRPADRKTSLTELQNIRHQGFAIMRRPRADGVDVVVAPIIGPDGKALAALACVCPNFRASAFHLKQMLQALNTAAIETSALTGGKLEIFSEELLDDAIELSFAPEATCLA